MTVSYTGSFVRLIFYWKGSVWKAVWKELMVWLFLYYAIRICIQYSFKDQSLPIDIVNLFSDFIGELPIEFMLGFYVAQIITRWWSQVLLIPWPDDAMALVNGAIYGQDSDSRMRRHAVARHLVLCQILALRKVSLRVRKRFPTIDHLVSAGLMTKEEHQNYLAVPNEYVRWQVPLSWAQNMVVPLVGSDTKQSVSPVLATAIFVEFNKFRAALRTAMTYDWICIPLVYTQAVGVGLYGYFGMSLLGRQFFGKPLDIYIPFLTVLKFVFYIGWFKVAQDMMRPFGEDDDDVELNYLIERHLQAAFTFADFACEQNLKPQVDRFSENVKGQTVSGLFKMPHTKLSYLIGDRPPKDHNNLENYKEKDLLEFITTDSDATVKQMFSDPETMLF